jgi:hypothetical protein
LATLVSRVWTPWLRVRGYRASFGSKIHFGTDQPQDGEKNGTAVALGLQFFPVMHTQILNRVGKIMLPASSDLPLEPSVNLDDTVTTAIEVMIRHNRDAIAVFWNKRPVGQVRLQDAFAVIGIRIS